MMEPQGSLLIVDDNEMNRDMLSRRLKRKGFETEVAENGHRALDLIQSAEGLYDVILLDIMMPEINGIEILKILRESYSMAELPVIMVSAKDQSKDIAEALNLGANDYVTKPIDFPVALARIQTQLVRKRAEEALRASEAKNRAMLNAIPDVLFRLDKENAFLDFQGDFIFGGHGDKAEVVGESMAEVAPREVCTLFEDGITEVLETNETKVVEFGMSRDGHFYDYEARIVSSGEQEVLALVRDITERKHIERMRNEFISILTHDLRTSLTSIRGALGLIAKGMAGELPVHMRALVDIAHKNSERLVRLINDILDIEMMESGKIPLTREPLPLVGLLEQAIDASQATFGKQFDVEFALNNEFSEAQVNADSDRLFQVVTKLLFNAAKFSPTNDQVLVKVTGEDSHVVVSITDRGPSIPEAFRSRIFQKFAQTDTHTRQHGDTGLGLSISKAIIEQMDGYIGFRPGDDGGNTFYFALPLWQQEPKSEG